MNTDPVCGAPIEPEGSLYSSEYGGETFFFCSASCKEQFDMNPAAYAARRAA